MIKIEFSGLSFQATAFKDETFNEGFLIPAADDVVPISSEWNSEIYDVQFIVYDTYSFKLYLRDSKYQSFQKIQYASKINIFENTGNLLTVKIVEFNAEKYLNEFWKIELIVKDIGGKFIENVILAEKIDTFYITDGIGNEFTTNINLPILDNIEYSQILIDEFKDKLIDYNKVSELKMIRFYLEKNQLLSFYNAIDNITMYSTLFIKIQMTEYRQYLIKKEDIGNNLFEITLTLYKENRITV